MAINIYIYIDSTVFNWMIEQSLGILGILLMEEIRLTS